MYIVYRHAPMFHYALNTSYFGSLFYFLMFHMIAIFILFSIITGLIWEIFNMLDAKSKELIDRMEEQEKALAAKQEVKNYKKRCKLEGKESLKSIRSIISQSNSQIISIDSELEISEEEEKEKISVDEEMGSDPHSDLDMSSPPRESHKIRFKRRFRRTGFWNQLEDPLTRQKTTSFNTIFSLRSMLGQLNTSKKDEDIVNIDWHKQMKSQYILNQTLLKNASRIKIKQMENNYLEKKFVTYQDITDKILSEWKNSNPEDYKRVTLQGSLILITLR